MPWPTEPEVDDDRQQFLTDRRAVTPDTQQGVYPCKDVKLTRADVECGSLVEYWSTEPARCRRTHTQPVVGEPTPFSLSELTTATLPPHT
jgi:hypothetical protein